MILSVLQINTLKRPFKSAANDLINMAKLIIFFLIFTSRVNLIKADELLKKDIGVLGMGKSDPYAVLEVGTRKYETKCIKNTITPEWFHTSDFPIEVVEGQTLSIEVFDHDDPGMYIFIFP